MPATTTRGLVFGALMAALTVVFHGVSLVLPLTIHLPLPTALVILRHGLRAGVLSAVVSSLLAALLFGWAGVAINLVPLGLLPGLVLGWALHRKKSPTVTGASIALAALVGLLLTIGLSLAIMGQNPLEIQMNLSTQMFQEWLNRLPAQQQQQVRPLVEALPTLMRTVLPLGLALNAAMMAILTYYLARLVFPRLGHPVEPLPPFSRWSLPVWSIWAYVLMITPALLVHQQLPSWARTVAINLSVGMQFLFALQGGAVAAWWLQERQGISPRAATWIGVLLVILLGQYVGFLGVFDLAFDFRRLRLGPRPGAST